MKKNPPENQSGLALDQGNGLRIVKARALSAEDADWDSVFAGYEKIRILTYSASTAAIFKILTRHDFTDVECVFGCERTLHQLKHILSFQKVVTEDVRAAIMGLEDARHVEILKRVSAGQARFRIMREYVAHAKIYLLSNFRDDSIRVMVGSANLSELAFSGKQPETLQVFDNDQTAWQIYNRMYEKIRDDASDEIPLPEERIIKKEINLVETPVVSEKSGTILIQPPPREAIQSVQQVERIEKLAAVIAPRVDPIAVEARVNGNIAITPQIRETIKRVHLVKSSAEAEHRYFSINREERTAILTGNAFPLQWDADCVAADVKLLNGFFANYDSAFDGDVPRLQQDYFILSSWLYFSPFMCDVRSLAALRDADLIRYPLFAIVFGKSHCGKTSLVDTLLTSMFGPVNISPIPKREFQTTKLQALQQGYRRFPVFFDDIGRSAFTRHGKDMIKDENFPGIPEYPGFILSMNADPHSFPDEVVKRSLMIYTTTGLPAYKEKLRQQLDTSVRDIRRGLSGHLYRRYASEIIERLGSNPLPEDWLLLSTEVLGGIMAEFTDGPIPEWRKPVGWYEYTDRRYDRVQSILKEILQPAFYRRKGNDHLSISWILEKGNRIAVYEQKDAFGRKEIPWADFPSTLIDDNASIGGKTVLHRKEVEEFIDQEVRPPKPWWRPKR